MNKPGEWVALDLETTSLQTDSAKIVEIALWGPDGEVFHSLVDPGIPMPKEAEAVHHISDEALAMAGAPPFALIAPAIQAYVSEAAGLVGYRSRAFDTLILHRELRDAGHPGIDLEQVKEIDLYQVWAQCEPRTLEGAVRRYLGENHEGAHGALADASIIVRLLPAMAALHGLTTAQLLSLSKPADEVDRSGKLRKLEDGTVVFAFGAHEGKPVSDFPEYIAWMRGKNFPADTMQKLKEMGL